MYVHYMYVCTIGKGVDGRVVFFSGWSAGETLEQPGQVIVPPNCAASQELRPRSVIDGWVDNPGGVRRPGSFSRRGQSRCRVP